MYMDNKCLKFHSKVVQSIARVVANMFWDLFFVATSSTLQTSSRIDCFRTHGLPRFSSMWSLSLHEMWNVEDLQKQISARHVRRHLYKNGTQATTLTIMNGYQAICIASDCDLMYDWERSSSLLATKAVTTLWFSFRELWISSSHCSGSLLRSRFLGCHATLPQRNGCSNPNNIPFPILANHGFRSIFWERFRANLSKQISFLSSHYMVGKSQIYRNAVPVHMETGDPE